MSLTRLVVLGSKEMVKELPPTHTHNNGGMWKGHRSQVKVLPTAEWSHWGRKVTRVKLSPRAQAERVGSVPISTND